MTPTDPRHGTPRGYRLHREHDQPACDACARAWYRYGKRATYLRLTGQPLRMTSLGTQRRVRALQALGYGLPCLAAELGIATGNLSYKMHQPYVARRTYEAVCALFDRFAMAAPPQGWVAQRTRNIARKKGWAPPLAWNDIDDPNDDPTNALHTEVVSKDIDEAVVLRVLGGESALASVASPAERGEVAARWAASGGSMKELARITGWKPERYWKASA